MTPETTAEETTEETPQQDVSDDTDNTTEQESTQTQDETLMEDAADAAETSDTSDDLLGSVPDHMVTDDGELDTQEAYKSYQGLVQEVDDADIPHEDVIDENGNIKEDVLIKQRNELRKKMSQSDDEDDNDEQESDEDDNEEDVSDDVPESPDDYDIELSDDENVEINDEALDIAKEAGHDAELTESQLQEFVQNYESQIAEQQQKNLEEEYKKISDDMDEARKVVNETNDWLEGLHQQGHLSDQELNKAREMGDDATAINVFRRFKQMTKEEPIPTDTGSATGESLDDLKARQQEILDSDGYYEPGHPKHEQLVNEAQKISEKIAEIEES